MKLPVSQMQRKFWISTKSQLFMLTKAFEFHVKQISITFNHLFIHYQLYRISLLTLVETQIPVLHTLTIIFDGQQRMTGVNTIATTLPSILQMTEVVRITLWT